MKNKILNILKIIGLILIIATLIGGFILFINTYADKTIEIYVINRQKELAYYVIGTESKFQIYADESVGFAYITNVRRKKSTETLYKVDLKNNVIIVKKIGGTKKTIEII